jgi:hypothetical protein
VVATNDSILCSKTLTYGGTLIVTNSGPGQLVDGDTFRLFNAATNLSAFSATNLLSLDPGFRWDTSGLGTGVVRVVYVGLGEPEFQSVGLSETNLIFAGSNGVMGLSYYLLTSTNLNLSMWNWKPVLTNTFGPGGSFSNAVPVNPHEDVRFYRLQQVN